MKLRAMSCAISLGAVLTFSTASMADSAEPFQNELGFSFGKESDSNDTFETTTIQFDVTHYLQPVNVANHPLAEAAFLERTGSVSFIYKQASTDYKDSFFPVTIDQTMYAAEFDYASTTSPLNFTAAYARITFAGDALNAETSGNQMLFKAGTYLDNSGRIQGVVSLIDFEDSSSTVIGLDAKLVHELGNDTALGVDGLVFSSEGDSPDGPVHRSGYTVDVDYYINRVTNIGFSREWQDYKDPNGSFDSWTHRFRIKHFLSSKASIAFEYMNTDTDSDTDGFNVKFALRI